MKTDKIINDLENEWDIPNGFLGSLRSGIFQVERAESFIKLIKSIEINRETINRRLVSLIWFIPLFMSWQEDRVLEKGGNVKQLRKVMNEITSILQEKLGVP